MNLSVTELVMASIGNPILSYNSFLGQWSFSQTICRMNALGMTYLGKMTLIKILFLLLRQLLNPFRKSVHCDADRAGSPEVHDGHQVSQRAEIETENEGHSRDKQFPLSTSCTTFITLLFIWIYSFLVSFPPLIGFGTFGLNSLGVRWVVN